ncbi:MAG: hypothetical protein FWE37_07950 [Spirochaetaceae bacterium]|nr:hypothetical protein [Spirochaetaceae bacterium]
MLIFFSKVQSSLKLINYKLFFALLLIGLFPAIYTAVRVFFLGQMLDSWSFSIAAQMQWLGVLYEVIQEAFILPLYFFIGKAFAERHKNDVNSSQNAFELSNMVKTGLLIVFIVYTALSLFIIIFANPLVGFMGQDSAIINQTVSYIRLETVANIFSTLFMFMLVVLVTINKEKYLYAILFLQMLLTIISDTFLISMLPISLQLGVNGMAITNIIVNILLLVLSIIILNREGIKLFNHSKLSFKWTSGWAKISGISGLESLVRNTFFIFMIVRMVNMVGEQGTFWVTNNFIWVWLLLPVFQLGELIKRDCGENNRQAIQQKTLGYFALTTLFVVLWFVTIPLWQPFLRDILQLNNYYDIFYLTLISIGFYVFFAYNNVIDSIFYGIGKTKYMLYQALITNIIFYGGAFIFYMMGIYQPTLVSIALMFAIGTAFDSLVTFIMFVFMLKKEKLKII